MDSIMASMKLDISKQLARLMRERDVFPRVRCHVQRAFLNQQSIAFLVRLRESLAETRSFALPISLA